MAKRYKNRAMSSEGSSGGDLFFFPKHNPPVAITASSLEKAEELLKDIKDIKDKEVSDSPIE